MVVVILTLESYVRVDHFWLVGLHFNLVQSNDLEAELFVWAQDCTNY